MTVIAGKYPLYDSAASRLYLSKDCYFEPVSKEAWRYQIGAHQVCRKWLRDRRSKVLGQEDLAAFHAVIRAVEKAIICEHEIEREIAAAGGWPDAFAGQCRSDSSGASENSASSSKLAPSAKFS
jgi:hypothetical protein